MLAGAYFISVTYYLQLLAAFRDQLATHFTLEESYGYFEDPIQVAPWLSNTANKLRKQHSSLYVEITRIVELGETYEYEECLRRHWRNLTQSFCAFDDKLDEHESAENQLIQEALLQDIGIGD